FTVRPIEPGSSHLATTAIDPMSAFLRLGGSMSTERLRAGSVLAALLLTLLPGIVAAQDTGTIAGVVKDSTGGVLPGVTVEVASPALIEKVRTATTDGQGQYKIVSLRPG